ncbi:MAG: YigZ family protein [Acholeplasmatales bacterium]|jgi:uncharacterized YigZ family protein|nr:YigZ family protein [Acholeplasmatales bacterium]
MDNLKYYILETSYNEIIINKSKFISIIFYVKNEEDIKNILLKLKKEYTDATHITYAYVLEENFYHCFDDGEPSGTAGKPILNSMLENNIVSALCVVIRYYGGIKLGAGGLIRAYGNSASSVISISKKYIKVIKKQFNISFSYNLINDIEQFISKHDGVIINKTYDSNITYIISISSIDDIKYLLSSFQELEDITTFVRI